MKPIEPNAQKRPCILVATPSHDHKLNVCMAVSVMNLMASRKVAMKMFLPGQSGISKGRNHCLWHFLNDFPEATHILFWDSDIEAHVDMIPALIERNVPVVGWLYPHKTEALRWCLNLKKPDGAKDDDEVAPIKDGPLAGLLPVDTVGTGGMLIQRSAIEKLRELFGEELAYKEDQESDGNSTPLGSISYGFCQERIISENGPEDKLRRIREILEKDKDSDTYLDISRKHTAMRHVLDEPQLPGRYHTEDWFLCRLFRRAGIPMYAETRFHVLHEGMMRYPLKEHRSPPWVPAKELEPAPQS